MTTTLSPFEELAFGIAIAANEIRVARGWSQAELARRMGTKQSKIARIERAQENLRLTTLIRLAEALDATIVLDVEPVVRPPSRRTGAPRARAGRRSSGR